MNPLEAMAKAIYDKWNKLSGWVPWVPGGNSDMQELARDCARAARDALADNVSEGMALGVLLQMGNSFQRRAMQICPA
jgi:hypothetical protein